MTPMVVIKCLKEDLKCKNQQCVSDATGFDLQRIKNIEAGRVKKFTDEEIEKIIELSTLTKEAILMIDDEIVLKDRIDYKPILDAVINNVANKSFKNKIDINVAINSMKEQMAERDREFAYLDKLVPANDHVALQLVGSKAQYLSRSNFIHAPIISAKASAGNGAIHYEVEAVGQLMVDKMMFKTDPNYQKVRAIEVMGDSMYPTLKEHDYVIIEENLQYSGDGIYVLQFDSMLLVKRLQATSRGIKVISDNQNYQDDEYNPNDDQRTFNIIGKVILRIQR